MMESVCHWIYLLICERYGMMYSCHPDPLTRSIIRVAANSSETHTYFIRRHTHTVRHFEISYIPRATDYTNNASLYGVSTSTFIYIFIFCIDFGFCYFHFLTLYYCVRIEIHIRLLPRRFVFIIIITMYCSSSSFKLRFPSSIWFRLVIVLFLWIVHYIRYSWRPWRHRQCGGWMFAESQLRLDNVVGSIVSFFVAFVNGICDVCVSSWWWTWFSRSLFHFRTKFFSVFVKMASPSTSFVVVDKYIFTLRLRSRARMGEKRALGWFGSE